MDRQTGWLMIALALLASGMLGAFASAWWRRKSEQARRRIPRKWPLAVRALVNSNEQRIWCWLVQAFEDQQVMIKLPVTRFTMPQVKDEGQHWFKLLSGVYCTFTVCTSDGSVIGCVDVPGPLGFSLCNQTLKHTLLSQCNIHYWVVDPDNLPSSADIRAAFLGEEAAQQAGLARGRPSAQLTPARLRERHHTASEFIRLDEALSSDPCSQMDYESQLSTSWQHNSFVAPLDSRRAELR